MDLTGAVVGDRPLQRDGVGERLLVGRELRLLKIHLEPGGRYTGVVQVGEDCEEGIREIERVFTVVKREACTRAEDVDVIVVARLV